MTPDHRQLRQLPCTMYPHDSLVPHKFWPPSKTTPLYPTSTDHQLRQLPCWFQLQEQDLDAAKLYSQCLGITGDWLAQTHSENTNSVLDDYLMKAVDLMEAQSSDRSGDEAALDAFLSLGRFADTQYQNRNNYMKSSTFEAKQALAHRAKEDAKKLQEIGEGKT